jgi:hypothetical protein
LETDLRSLQKPRLWLDPKGFITDAARVAVFFHDLLFKGICDIRLGFSLCGKCPQFSTIMDIAVVPIFLHFSAMFLSRILVFFTLQYKTWALNFYKFLFNIPIVE